MSYRAPTTEKLGTESYKSHHFEQPAATWKDAPLGPEPTSAPPATKERNTPVIRPELKMNNAEDASQPSPPVDGGY